MQVRRIIGVAALGAAAASLVLVPGASAQEPEVTTLTYGASASGQALALSVFGEELTVGQTLAGLESTLDATAQGLGLATGLFQGGATEASVSGEGTDGSAEETCEAVLPEIPGLSIDLACSSSLASVIGGVPAALSTGRVGEIVVNPIQPLLDTPLVAVLEPVEGAVDQLLEGLRPITTAVDDAADLGLEDTLDDLFGALFAGADLVSIELGPTATQNVVGTEGVSAACSSAGGRIDVLDLPAVGGIDPEPVISIIVGNATTAVAVDTVDALATPTVDPAIVTVVVPSLGIDLPIGPGQTIEIPLPEPLGTSTIAVAGGTTGVDEAGRTFARADGVLVDLLNGSAMMGGVELALANCASVAGAVVPVQIPTTTTAPTATTAPPGPLPRTGGTSSTALLAAVGLAGLGLVLLRRPDGATD